MGRFILTKRCLLGQGLAVEAATLQLHCGQQISSMALLPLKRNSKTGRVRLVLMCPSFFLREQPTVLVEVRYVCVQRQFFSFTHSYQAPCFQFALTCVGLCSKSYISCCFCFGSLSLELNMVISRSSLGIRYQSCGSHFGSHKLERSL